MGIVAITIDPMTTKERLHKLVDELTDVEARSARIVVDDIEVAARDEHADLEAMLDEETDELLGEMEAEERKAGFGPWHT